MTRAGRLAAWQIAVLEERPVAPTVLVLGGFLTSPPLYRPLASRLQARGVAAVVIANVWTPDWLLAAARGLGPILTRSGRALLAAGDRSAASPRSLGAPVLVVGHSAGGMTARLLTSPEPFAGRRLNASGRIAAIVTLGTPHLVSAAAEPGHRISVEATAHADRVVPGPWFAPRIGYLAVASRAVVGRPDGSGIERAAWRLYQGLLPDPSRTAHPGDGLVPVESARLPGAASIVLDRAAHGQGSTRPWYGSEDHLDHWWPAALAAWQAALQARAVTSFDRYGCFRG